MKVQLEAVAFNHDPTSADSDALNLRLNASEFVSVPEWQAGRSVDPEDSPAAYAMSTTPGRVITIKAKFRALDPLLKQVEIRAVDPLLPSGPISFEWFMALPGAILRRLLRGNVLGRVRPRVVKFLAGGATNLEEFELSGVRIRDWGVGIWLTTWRWQFRSAQGRWIDFETSRHRVYVIVDVPKAPWSQSPYVANNGQLPWVEVLDYACFWAARVKDAGDAASRVTRSVNNLGGDIFWYDCYSNYSGYCSISGKFDCTGFLRRLKKRGGSSVYVNCLDCSAIVAIFSNILGADLAQARLRRPYSKVFGLNPVLLIGSKIWRSCVSGFIFHEVALRKMNNGSEGIFDCCLQVDGDRVPAALPSTPLLPTNLPFGSAGGLLYRDRLIVPGDQSDCRLILNSSTREIV